MSCDLIAEALQFEVDSRVAYISTEREELKKEVADLNQERNAIVNQLKAVTIELERERVYRSKLEAYMQTCLPEEYPAHQRLLDLQMSYDIMANELESARKETLCAWEAVASLKLENDALTVEITRATEECKAERIAALVDEGMRAERTALEQRLVRAYRQIESETIRAERARDEANDLRRELRGLPPLLGDPLTATLAKLSRLDDEIAKLSGPTSLPPPWGYPRLQEPEL